ncbi:MAG: alpha/beta fold hydrolase [Xanthomonadales bacterium]|nr:alpha/beta fold hydrolase [Xanthomonadales bacterium]
MSGYYDPAPRPPARGPRGAAARLGGLGALALPDRRRGSAARGWLQPCSGCSSGTTANSHHLNPELFHSCRLEEVVEAFRWIAAQYAERPLFAVGFSLGGNFALRVALRAPAAGLPLAGVCAVCPVIDPAHGLAAIERAPRFYEQYFLAKWRASLRRKRALFPERYRFDDRALRRGLRDLTAWLVAEYTEYPSLAAYLDGYSVAGERLAGLEVPVRILTSADDPVIPVEDFRRLALPDSARLTVLSGGGTLRLPRRLVAAERGQRLDRRRAARRCAKAAGTRRWRWRPASPGW